MYPIQWRHCAASICYKIKIYTVLAITMQELYSISVVHHFRLIPNVLNRDVPHYTYLMPSSILNAYTVGYREAHSNMPRPPILYPPAVKRWYYHVIIVIYRHWQHIHPSLSKTHTKNAICIPFDSRKWYYISILNRNFLQIIYHAFLSTCHLYVASLYHFDLQ